MHIVFLHLSYKYSVPSLGYISKKKMELPAQGNLLTKYHSPDSDDLLVQGRHFILCMKLMVVLLLK